MSNEVKEIPLPQEGFVTISEDYFTTLWKCANRLELIADTFMDKEKSWMTDLHIKQAIDDGIIKELKGDR